MVWTGLTWLCLVRILVKGISTVMHGRTGLVWHWVVMKTHILLLSSEHRIVDLSICLSIDLLSIRSPVCVDCILAPVHVRLCTNTAFTEREREREQETERDKEKQNQTHNA